MKLFLFLLLTALPLASQQTLEQQLEGLPDDQKVVLYNNTADVLDAASADTIYRYALRALALLRNVENPKEQARAYLNIARVGLFLNNPEMQEDYLNRANALMFNDNSLKAEILYRLGSFYLETESVKAVGLFQESGVLATNAEKKHLAELNVAVAMRMAGQWVGAMNVINNLVEKNPSDAEAYNEWGNLLIDQNNYQGAVTQWEKALLLATFNQNHSIMGNAHYSLAMNAFNHNNLTVAIANAEKALQVAYNADNSALILKSQQLLADAYLKEGSTTLAFGMLKQASQTQVKQLETNRSALSIFSLNLIGFTAVSAENQKLTEQLKDQKFLTYMLFGFSSLLIVALLVFIQRWHSKDVEEKTATLAYNVLVSRSQKKRLNLKGRALNLWASNTVFSLYHISISCSNPKIANNSMAMDYFSGLMQSHIEQVLASTEFFKNPLLANNFYLLVSNQAIDSLLVDEILAENHTLNTVWQNEKIVISMKTSKFFNQNQPMEALKTYREEGETHLYF